MAYIVISNLKISEAVIEAEEGGFCLVKLPDTGARFRVRKSRIHAKREDATEHLRNPRAPVSSPIRCRSATPYDYEPGGARWAKERAFG